jgi:hypothetical protein
VHAGVTGETVTAMVVKGLISCDAGAALALTDLAPCSGRCCRNCYSRRPSPAEGPLPKEDRPSAAVLLTDKIDPLRTLQTAD